MLPECLLGATAILTLALLLFVWFNLHLYYKRSQYAGIARPPLEPGLRWCLGHALTIAPRINPETSFTALMAELSEDLESDIFVLFFLNMNFLLLLDVSKPGKVLMNHRVFLKQGGKRDNMAFIDGNRVLGERGMVTEIGSEIWYHKRRTVDAAFHKTALKDYVGQMNDISKKLSLYLVQTKDSSCVDVYEVFTRVALETICRCGFNLNEDLIFSEDTLLAKAFHHIFYAAQLQFQCKLKFMMPWGFRKEKAALRKHIQMVRHYLTKRLQDKIKLLQEGHEDKRDMLHYIIKGNLYNDKLQTEDVLDDFFVFVLAGMETTAIVMALFMFYMLKNEEVLEKVRREVDEVFGDKEALTMKDTARLTYMDQCIKETLRIHPPAQATLRVNWDKDVQVEDLFIPRATNIIICQEVMHRRADLWPTPMKFDPDRFGPDAPEIKPFTFMPFMAGPRSCVGKHFAILEMKIMLSRLIRDFNLVDPNPELKEIPMKTVVTAKPKDGVKVGLRKRVTDVGSYPSYWR